MAASVVRLATESDCLDILRWRNDAVTRAMSRDSGALDEQQHRAWFAKALKDPTKLLLIGIVDNTKFGVVRFDLHSAMEWEVSIAVAPEFRGKGLGKSLLHLALSRFFSIYSEARVIAEILENNTNSERLFRSLGFLAICTEGEFKRYALKNPEG